MSLLISINMSVMMLNMIVKFRMDLWSMANMSEIRLVQVGLK